MGQLSLIIAGPCVIESRDHCLFLASELKKILFDSGFSFIFKASFDKANRTSAESPRGPGIDEGLKILAEVRSHVGVPVLSDVHEVAQVEQAAEVLDVIQIPAFLCRQTDLLVAAAKTGKPVNVKKGQFLSPWDAEHIVRKVEGVGGECWLTERGSSFGYNNLVVDFRSIPIMKSFCDKVILDVTHSVQTPGGEGGKSGGAPEFIPTLAACGLAAGVDGLFFEVHEEPSRALSDGPNALRLDLMPELIGRLKRISEAA